MVKKHIKEGLQLGVLTGLTITLFDLLYVVKPSTFVPYGYISLIMIFNILFWGFIGGTSGLTIANLNRKKNIAHKKNSVYWVIVFILPFALIYGYLGQLQIPLPFKRSYLGPVYDHHLSFIWVLLIVGFQILYFKRYPKRKHINLLFILEIFFCIIIFHFCTNIKHYECLYNIASSLSLRAENFYLLLYIATIITILVTYLFLHYARLRINYSPNLTRKIVSIYTTTIIVCIAFLLFVMNEQPPDRPFFEVSEQNKKTGLTSPVILIVMDNVRADRLSIYGGHPKTTPKLMDLSHDAVVFENCIAASSWTTPSHASLFTGLYPREHGVHRIYKADSKSNRYETPFLSNKFITHFKKGTIYNSW